MRERLRIFTWHIHGSYLYYLSMGNYDLYIPVNAERTAGYYGRGNTFPFGTNVIEIPANEVRHLEFDLILYQADENYLRDQYDVLSEEQRSLPAIYLEHDPPWEHPTDTRHIIRDPYIPVVHVTHFNRLMWDNHSVPTHVIPHGVTEPGITYSGELEKGLVVINHLPQRGRMVGFDIFREVSRYIPLELAGMGAEELGFGEILHPDLPSSMSRYRFFFNPIRYTSMGLAVCEAMMLGIPVVGLATTEMAVHIRNGYSGFTHTDIGYLIEKMRLLLEQKDLAAEIGYRGQQYARKQFSIDRFVHDWEQLFRQVVISHRMSLERPYQTH